MTINRMIRSFKYAGLILPDPAPELDVESVRSFYAASYPEITTAALTGPEAVDGALVFTFVKAIGTKGLLAAAGEGATLAGQREPHRECSMAVSGDSLAWCREQAFRPSGGDFQGIGVYRSDGCLESAEARASALRSSSR
jgi:PRTRC genetic system protein C